MRKLMSVKEFREIGLLQEINRLLLHPMGLALEVVAEADGTECFGKVWDSRQDPEGIYFSDAPDPEKVRRVAALIESKASNRQARLGYVIQPVEACGDCKVK